MMKISLLSTLLSANSDTIWHLLPYTIGAFVIIVICTIIYGTIHESTREKLENEDKKEKYLLKRVSDEGFNLQKNLKEDESFVMFLVRPPYSSKKPWRVKRITEKPSSGGFTAAGTMEESSKMIFSISDAELNELIK